MSLQIQDGGPEGETSLGSLEMLLKTLHCENDQTKTSSFSHDWHVQPDCQRSITGVRLSGPFWIKEYTAELCVLELVALHSCGVPTDSRNLRAFTETTEVSGGCQWKFSADTRALAAPNLKDLPKTFALDA